MIVLRNQYLKIIEYIVIHTVVRGLQLHSLALSVLLSDTAFCLCVSVSEHIQLQCVSVSEHLQLQCVCMSVWCVWRAVAHAANFARVV